MLHHPAKSIEYERVSEKISFLLTFLIPAIKFDQTKHFLVGLTSMNIS
jgi:hypothetical protein